MGYVGLTLATTLANLDIKVWGYERNETVAEYLRNGRSHIFEPDVEEILQQRVGVNLAVETELPESFSGTVIICVSTPVDEDNKPDLRNLKAASASVAGRVTDGSQVIVRSTVPVGICRSVVLPEFQAQGKQVHLSCCPERTIQGQALRELRELPQVVGGIDEPSTAKAVTFWERVTRRVVPVSSIEAAEMVKLVNNCHTDLIYSYGNEVAMMADYAGLDPLEVIRAANLDYPRPDLARPGFVAGPCMSKDAYLLISSSGAAGYVPELVLAARRTNERLPGQVVQQFVQKLESINGTLDGAKILVCGFAYKGIPITDDVRGTPTAQIMEELSKYPMEIVGHDFMVPSDVISSYGAAPVDSLSQGFDGARAILFVNEHPDYQSLDIPSLIERMEHPALIYDCWRLFDSKSLGSIPGVHYAGISYG
jgi:UDP-N-acetyl-D-mannosaminuronic acid dehydrogenase